MMMMMMMMMIILMTMMMIIITTTTTATSKNKNENNNNKKQQSTLLFVKIGNCVSVQRLYSIIRHGLNGDPVITHHSPGQVNQEADHMYLAVQLIDNKTLHFSIAPRETSDNFWSQDTWHLLRLTHSSIFVLPHGEICFHKNSDYG